MHTPKPTAHSEVISDRFMLSSRRRNPSTTSSSNDIPHPSNPSKKGESLHGLSGFFQVNSFLWSHWDLGSYKEIQQRDNPWKHSKALESRSLGMEACQVPGTVGHVMNSKGWPSK